MTAKIFLDNMEKVKNFVSLAMTKDYDVDLISGKYVVNGKSIMGVFSLDLTKPLMVNANTTDEAFAEEIKEYLVEQK
jgi:phosphotransferase system HPr-like phosphotransfer protein